MDDKLRILLCEDDENLGMLLREYLQAKGYNADLFPDGEVGFKAFLKSKYDLVVTDVMMPRKDGFTLAQEIRQANAEVPIIFLTANAERRYSGRIQDWCGRLYYKAFQYGRADIPY